MQSHSFNTPLTSNLCNIVSWKAISIQPENTLYNLCSFMFFNDLHARNASLFSYFVNDFTLWKMLGCFNPNWGQIWANPMVAFIHNWPKFVLNQQCILWQHNLLVRDFFLKYSNIVNCLYPTDSLLVKQGCAWIVITVYKKYSNARML